MRLLKNKHGSMFTFMIWSALMFVIGFMVGKF